MNRHRTIICIGSLLVALSAAVPSAASASSLLSGYGGPGQGNQAILGSALVNGPKGGGGGGGSSSGSSESTSESSDSLSSGTSGEGTSSDKHTTAGGSGGSGGGSGGSGKGSSGASHHAKPRAFGKHSAHPAPAKPAVAASLYPAAERVPAGQPGALGLSGQDLFYILLGAVTLTLMGGVTRWLGRTDAPGTRG